MYYLALYEPTSTQVEGGIPCGVPPNWRLPTVEKKGTNLLWGSGDNVDGGNFSSQDYALPPPSSAVHWLRLVGYRG